MHLIGFFLHEMDIFRFVEDVEYQPPGENEHRTSINPLNAKLNSICHLLTLLGAHHILDISRIRVKCPSGWSY
jgi:hypothetical protein